MKNLSDTQTVITEMVRRIVRVWDPEKIILFGSYARGTEGPDSDVDLLVVMRLKRKKREIRLDIRRILSGMGIPKDIVVVSTEEMERYQECPGTIVRVALSEGKLLYERQT